MSLPTNEQWVTAMARVWDRYQVWYGDSDWEHYYAKASEHPLDHGCPPPLPLYQPGDRSTDTLWLGRRALWSWPASIQGRAMIPNNARIPLACAGTLYWLIVHTMKELRLEGIISSEQIETMKARGLDPKMGIAGAFTELGWSTHFITDPDDIRPGDVGCVGYFNEKDQGEIHHWFAAAPVSMEELHCLHRNRPAILTLGASPWAQGFGTDPYYKERTRRGKKRRWIVARWGE